MSVLHYEDNELRALGIRLAAAAKAPLDDVLVMLTALGLANRAAYLMSYPQEEQPMERPKLGEVPSREYDSSGWELGDWCRNLLYNCVTNAGTDFAPRNYVHEIEQLMLKANCSKR